MDYKNIEILNNFDQKDIPGLDIAVLGALELFQKEKLPELSFDTKHPLVVGSGNAEAVGRIIFEDKDAIFASESNYEKKLEQIKTIDSVIVISASGEKHAPIIIKRALELGKSVLLLTNNSHGEAVNLIGSDKVFVFPKNREPYTYNTSTYMGMILSKTHESTKDISDFIEKHIDTLTMPSLGKYDKYLFIVPPKFSNITRMLQIKFTELFGRKIAYNIETSEYMKHAVTVVPSNELFISFGDENKTWGAPENRLNIPLPENADYASIMAIGYYIIGQIQRQNPPYFKENIVTYTDGLSKIFGNTVSPIVE